MSEILSALTSEFKLQPKHVENIVNLIDDGDFLHRILGRPEPQSVIQHVFSGDAKMNDLRNQPYGGQDNCRSDQSNSD